MDQTYAGQDTASLSLNPEETKERISVHISQSCGSVSSNHPLVSLVFDLDPHAVHIVFLYVQYTTKTTMPWSFSSGNNLGRGFYSFFILNIDVFMSFYQLFLIIL